LTAFSNRSFFKDNPDKKLQWLALNVHLNGLAPRPAKTSSYYPFSGIVFLTKSVGLAFTIFKTLIRFRSAKVQSLLWKWGLVLYYTVFRFKAMSKVLLK
jgi:hypothetical protein